MESRRVWKEVADGIRNGNFDAASQAKSKLENTQRQKRKEELALQMPHHMKNFTLVDNDEVYRKLASSFGFQPAEQEGYYRKD